MKRILVIIALGLWGAAGGIFVPVLLLLPVALAYVALCWGGMYTVAAFVAACAGVGLVTGVQAPYAIAMLLPAAAALVLLFKNQSPYRSAVGCLTALFAVAYYLELCLPSLLAGEDAYAAMRELTGQVLTLYEAMGKVVGYSLPPAFSAVLLDMTPQLTMITVMATAMAYAFADVLLLRWIALKGGAKLRPMAKLWDWRLTKESLMGAGILVAGAIAVRLLSLKNAGAIVVTIEMILLGEFALNGFCYSEYMSRVFVRQSSGRQALRYVLYVLFFPYSLIVLCLTGIAECVFNLRDRLKNLPTNGPEE
ncbi:MAG: hypothetical protein Q4E65_02920 [Clostridia bacterium]|nr:hypothetical protein [Clostridia bacterium]